jgi:hypothetical protein
MSKCTLIFAVAVAVAACGDSSDETGESASSETTADQAAAAEAAEAAEAARQAAEAEAAAVDDRTQDLAGLSLLVNDDGTITLSGADRWGGRIDSTYADLEYFTNAVPVLRRSVNDEQGAALDAALEELRTGGGGSSSDDDEPSPGGVEGAGATEGAGASEAE